MSTQPKELEMRDALISAQSQTEADAERQAYLDEAHQAESTQFGVGRLHSEHDY